MKNNFTLPPKTPTRPVFGEWANRPRSEWTAEQMREYDMRWAEFENDVKHFMRWLESIPSYANDVVARKQV